MIKSFLIEPSLVTMISRKILAAVWFSPEIDTTTITDAVSGKLNHEAYVPSVRVETQATLCLCSQTIHRDWDVSLNILFPKIL